MKQNKHLVINGREITITPTPFEGKLSIEEYETQLYSALLKIGVTQKYIKISQNAQTQISSISWEINSEQFSFSCAVFETYQENFGACVQAIKEDIRHILRGIKDISLVLKQYKVENSLNPQPTSLHHNNTSLLTFNSSNNIDKNEINNDESNKFLKNQKNNKNSIESEIEAKTIIEEIKSRYPNFSNYSYLPDNDKIRLEKAYYYLGKKPHWK